MISSSRPAVLTDFDDTAAVQNVAEMLLTKFGDPTWHDVRQRFRDKELTLNEYQEITFRNIQADRATMQDYVKQNASLRPYFKEMWHYCREIQIPLAVVSQGLDFYIEALLEKEGCGSVPIHAVNTRFDAKGINYEYRYAVPGKESLGNSKGVVVDSYRAQGHYIVYVGDGMSDFEAATRADLVFAHRVLAYECERQEIPFRPFTDFGDVLKAVEEMTAGLSRNGKGPNAS
ncbi:MAG: MtnX-like HAD-IB family phosphatase [Chloroflexota bacterium]|nr:MtnX-like HAD-IB family phosphatase [Chloroflexota bacterium]